MSGFWSRSSIYSVRKGARATQSAGRIAAVCRCGMASSFRFGFGDAADDDDRVEAVQGSPAAGAFVAHFEEVAPPNRTSTSAPSQVVRVASWEFRQTVFDRRQLSDEYASLKALLHASDLLPNVYEGGFKLWECAVDLGRFAGLAIQGTVPPF